MFMLFKSTYYSMSRLNNSTIYYLISQECPNEQQMLTYAQDVLQKLEFVCVDHVNNLFEIIQHDDTSFEIIHILKNKGLGDKFNVGDIITLSGGMVAFSTTTNNKIECHPTAIIEKTKITLFDDNDDDLSCSF